LERQPRILAVDIEPESETELMGVDFVIHEPDQDPPVVAGIAVPRQISIAADRTGVIAHNQNTTPMNFRPSTGLHHVTANKRRSWPEILQSDSHCVQVMLLPPARFDQGPGEPAA
jgi:hypothetical protein